MRLRLCVVWALIVMLSLPATTTASSPYRYRILKNVCSWPAEQYYPSLQLWVELTEIGKSGTTQFQTETYVQFRNPPDDGGWGDWTYDMDSKATRTSRWRADTSRTRTWESRESRVGSDTSPNRLAMHIEFWHNAKLLADQWLYSNRC